MNCSCGSTPVHDVGMFFIVGFEGTRLTSQLETFIRQYYPGGLIFFSRNFESISQFRSLINDITRLNNELGTRKMLFAIDQEGGTVNRIRAPNFQVLPGAMALGHDPTGKLAYLAGEYVGKQLASLGIHVNFAPVLDLNTNPANPQLGLRSFGNDPGKVAFLGWEYSRGLMKANILPTGKHFPGLGDCVQDTHEELPVIKKNLEELLERELVPFIKLIQHEIPFIMTSHVCFPYIEENLPVTLSDKMLRHLLREQLGFKGIIVTDDLMMGGVQKIGSVAKAAVKTLLAGTDMCLICNSLEIAAESIQHVYRAVEQDELPLTSLEKSKTRISLLMKKINNTQSKMPTPGEAVTLARKIANHSVIMKGSPQLHLTAKNQPVVILYPEIRDLCPVSDNNVQEDNVKQLFKHRDDVKLQKIPVNPDINKVNQIVKRIRNKSSVVVTYDAFRFEGQQHLINKLHELGIKTIQVISGNPIDKNILEPSICQVFTHGSHPILIEKACQLIGLIK